MSLRQNISTVLHKPTVALDYATYKLGRRTVSVVFGGKLAGSTYSEIGSIRNLRPSRLEAELISSLPGVGVIFDVGAHVGIWTVPLALRHPNAMIHSFEASPKTFRNLEANVRRNHLRNVRLVQVAVSDRNGTLSFQIPHKGSLFSRILSSDNGRHRFDSADILEVPSVCLADYCRERDIDSIEFVKVDVEGAEVQVMRGLDPLLKSKRIQKIWIEVEPENLAEMGHSVAELADLVHAHGYIFSLLSEPDRPIDIRVERESNMLVRPRP
jgi:FkbM family methyltransferase